MTDRQKRSFERLILSAHPSRFHHGDCVGADADAHDVVECHGIEVEIHPPEISLMRAFKKSGVVCEHVEKPYLTRNRDIVDCSDWLIACPKGPEELRSGTWSTVRYARKREKMVAIVWPDGLVQLDV